MHNSKEGLLFYRKKLKLAEETTDEEVLEIIKLTRFLATQYIDLTKSPEFESKVKKLNKRDPILMEEIYSKFASYFEVVSDHSFYGNILEVIDITIIGLTVTILEYYLGRVYYDEKGFFTAYGPFEIFRKCITREQVDLYLSKALDSSNSVLKSLKEWLDSNYDHYATDSDLLHSQIHEISRQLQTIQ